MSDYKTLDDVEVRDRRVLVRVDLNLPMQGGTVTDFTRVDRILPTLQHLKSAGAKTVLLSHFGRPKGKRLPEMSLEPIAEALSARGGFRVIFAPDCIGDQAEDAVRDMSAGDILLLENVRFHPGEEANDGDFADRLAALGDLYVNDAFSCAHRAHASTEAIAHRLPAVAGKCMEAELTALRLALETPRRPVAAIVGGAKISTKLDVLSHLIDRTDTLIIGGAMANTFLQAEGIAVGKSLSEPELGETARAVSAKAAEKGCRLILPIDVAVAEELAAGAAARNAAVEEIEPAELALDLGEKSIKQLLEVLEEQETLLWNGPLGAFEFPPFDRATVDVACKAADLTTAGRLVTVAGGGDTVAALNHAGVGDRFTYVSTAGGAFLEWLEGKELPGIKALRTS